MVKRCLILWAFKMREFHDIKSWKSKQVFVAHFIPKMQICDQNVEQKSLFHQYYLPIKPFLTLKCVKKTLLYSHTDSEPAARPEIMLYFRYTW